MPYINKGKMKARENLIGAYAFLGGVILAVILGLFQTRLEAASTAINYLLAILGIVVGFFINVSERDISKFLIAGVSLVVVSYMGQEALGIVSSLGRVLGALLVLFVPATVIVALKDIFSVSNINLNR